MKNGRFVASDLVRSDIVMPITFAVRGIEEWRRVSPKLSRRLLQAF